MNRVAAKWDPQSIYFCLYAQKKRLQQKSCWIMKAARDNKCWSDNYWWNLSSLPQTVISGSKRHTYLSTNSSSHFSSADIFKSKAWKSNLSRDNGRDASQKTHANLDWQLYIWGRYDLVLMLRLATWLMWPRSVLTGHWASGRRGQSWKVGKWLRLHSCDWPRPSGWPPMISHVPAEQRSSDPTMKEREYDKMIKRVWKNNGDQLQWTSRMQRECTAIGEKWEK